MFGDEEADGVGVVCGDACPDEDGGVFEGFGVGRHCGIFVVLFGMFEMRWDVCVCDGFEKYFFVILLWEIIVLVVRDVCVCYIRD